MRAIMHEFARELKMLAFVARLFGAPCRKSRDFSEIEDAPALAPPRLLIAKNWS